LILGFWVALVAGDQCLRLGTRTLVASHQCHPTDTLKRYCA
jgi:hypothetical protein